MATRNYDEYVKDVLITDIYGNEYEGQATLENAWGQSKYVEFYDTNEDDEIIILRTDIDELVVL
jgi:hypothetical protein